MTGDILRFVGRLFVMVGQLIESEDDDSALYWENRIMNEVTAIRNNRLDLKRDIEELAKRDQDLLDAAVPPKGGE